MANEVVNFQEIKDTAELGKLAKAAIEKCDANIKHGEDLFITAGRYLAEAGNT
jgi:hypothetical protein